nr:MAG TPA: hypothetical protein [Caudoviricetes sp.]
MSNENTENKQNKTEEKKESAEKNSWIKFSWAMTGVVAISAAVGYAAGFATTKLLSK